MYGYAKKGRNGFGHFEKRGKQRGQQEHRTYSRTLGFRGDQATDIFQLNRNTSQRNSRENRSKGRWRITGNTRRNNTERRAKTDMSKSCGKIYY